MDSSARHRRAGRAARFAAACAVAAAVAPAAAQAAYAPKLAIKVDPPTMSSTIKLSSTVTQAAGEEASRKAVVSFPKGFGLRFAALGTLVACTEAQFNSSACPPATRIGSVEADAGFPVGIVSGGVYYGGADSGTPTLYAFLSNSLTHLLGQDQKLKATTAFRPDGGIDTIFDNLPNVATTRLTFTIDAGANGLLAAPQTCGAFVFRAQFTSQSGATAASEAPVTISGCPVVPPPVVRPKLSPIRLAAVVSHVGGGVARSRANVRGNLTIRLRKRGKRNPFFTKRVVVKAPGPITIRGVGRDLNAGYYVFQLSLRSSGRTATRSRTFRVR